ncbi:MAG: SUMF1/EgtB/PvdO family nonheme iron enzyme [Bacteroidales bacterium]|nr:SUMF1/EgtB/PvdO family nonheme iron enzyme [Candidatus Sodaliphilus limicaballi]
MKQILLSLLLLCSLGISAQTTVVTRQKKQQTTTTAPKQNSSQKPAKKKQSASTTQPKPQSKPTVPRVTASYSNGTLTVNGANYPMVYVQAGTFTMGATSEMEDPLDYEKPTHQVTLTYDYYIGKTEVTQALWKAVMGNNPSEFKGDNLPVESVSWNDCQKFISKLNSMTGQSFRLPTEAEWEFAARGGNYSNHYQYSGSNKLGDVAWYDGNSGMKTHAVATKQPNELGLYDMSGNVWEWCSDWYGKYRSSSQTNPTGPSSGSGRVFRGGGFFDAGYCRSSFRNYDAPDYSPSIPGLRLVLVP